MGLTPLPPLAALPAPSLTGGVGSAVNTAVATAAAVATGGASLIFGISASRLIAIAVGLILIAAAVFAFKPAREVIVGTVKEGAKAAAVAA